MAIISAGYDGTVDERQWAGLLPKAGASEYGVDGGSDFKVSAVAGQDRTVSVAPGTAWGRSVVDVMDANDTKQLGTVTSGSRWDLVVLRRDWQPPGGSTSVVVIPGGSARALPTRNYNPGVIDDQPLALVRVQSGSTAIAEIVDLRVWARNGGATANDDLVRSYLVGLGTNIEINGTVWIRRLTNNGTTEWADQSKLNDTGWLTREVSLNPAANFRIDSYRFRVKNGELIGRIDATYLSFNEITVSSNGNVNDTLLTSLPAGYRPAISPWPVQALQPGINEWFARLEDDGTVVLSHGTPGAVLRKNDPIRFIFRVPLD